MQDSLRNATVVITSAASGLGRAAALAFARQGARVVLAGPHAEALAVVVAQCQRLGAPALAVPVDAADAASARLLARAANAFGGQIDLWVDGTTGRPTAATGSRKWLTAGLVAGLAGAAAGFFAWRKRTREEDYSYFGHGAQL